MIWGFIAIIFERDASLHIRTSKNAFHGPGVSSEAELLEPCAYDADIEAGVPKILGARHGLFATPLLRPGCCGSEGQPDHCEAFPHKCVRDLDIRLILRVLNPSNSRLRQTA